MKPTLSIIIPTKNRYDYLKEVLKLLIELKQDNVEFVVTDNSPDNSEFYPFIQQINDSRIKYFHVKENMSQTGNSDYALNKVTGDYVCFIGDDDMVLDNIFDITQKMIAENIDCMIQSPVTYYWSDVRFRFSLNAQKPASFIIEDNYENDFENVDVDKELLSILDSGATRIGMLPRVYHGIVKKELLDKVKVKCGSYFPGPSPDMANSVAISLFSPKTIYSKLPFTISGKSGKSASGMGLQHTHAGDLNKDFLPKNVIETWNKKIPQFWSCSTIWAQSAFYSLNASGSNLDINYTALYSNLLVFEPGFKTKIEEKVKAYCTFSERLTILSNRLSLFFLRAKSFILRKYFSESGMTTYYDINTIKECYLKVNNLLAVNDL